MKNNQVQSSIENKVIEIKMNNKLATKKWQSNKFFVFIKSKNKLIDNYSLFGSIALLIIMFFVSLSINAKVGYYLDGQHFNSYNKLLDSAIAFGVISLLIYLPIIIFNIGELISIFVYKQRISIFNFSLLSYLNLNNFVFIILIFVFSFVDYKLFFIFEILLIFVSLIFLYKKIDKTFEMDFYFIKKINSKFLQF